MDQLTTQLEQVASSLVAADQNNLPALAQVHTALSTLEAIAKSGAEPRPDVAGVAAQLASSIERIILDEAADSEAALEDVIRSVGELRDLVNGVADKSQHLAVVGASVADGASRARVAAPPVIEQESLIPETDVSLAHEFIAEAAAHLDTAETALLEIESGTGSHESINAVFRSFHTIKGVAGFINLRQIGALAHVAEGLLDAARHGRLTLTGTSLEHVLEALDMMRTLLRTLGEAIRASRPQPSEGALPGLIARITQIVSSIHQTKSETVGNVPGHQTGAPGLAHARESATQEGTPQTRSADTGEVPASEGKRVDADAMVKVGTARLDSLINMVGELLIAQAMVREGALEYASKNPPLMRSMAHLSKIARELQDLSMSMRMVPIQGVFQKMARLVRDVARKAGKEVEFVTVGGETELDRNVVEAVSDPLVHMVRNAIDHGLEPSEERLALGKPAAGKVELRACHQSGSVVIQITDDGRGLNREKIIKKAVDAGIARPDQQFTDQEAFALIFHAGLSTAEKITDVSGRGVGMDVVRRNVESLRGRIEITSTPGKGSVFTIRLPLTLAMIDGMVVRVGDARFIVPMTSIEQSLRPKQDQLSTVQGRGEVCMVRGSLLPLYRLSSIFEIKGSVTNPEDALTVILQDNDRRCCMLVDELLGQQQVVIKSLGSTVGRIPGVSGGAILGDGAVSLILDVPGLMDLAIETYSGASSQTSESMQGGGACGEQGNTR